MQYVLDVASSDCFQDHIPPDCREDHESRIAGDRYGNRHQKVSRPRPTDRSAQLTWCRRWTPWGTSAKFRERQWQTSVQSLPLTFNRETG